MVVAGGWTPSVATRRGVKRVWLDAVTARTVTSMRERGVRPILLKGPTIARWLYAEGPDARGYEDVDLIVAHDQLEMAETVLTELGFERRTVLLLDDPEPHAEAFVRSSDGANVDLHRTLHRCEYVPNDLIWGCVSRNTATMLVGGVEVEVPSIPVRLLHVALHVDPVKHTRQDRAFVDLERAIERVDFQDWQRAAALARRLDTADAMGFGLRLTPHGEQVADRLGLPRSVPEGAVLREAPASAQFLARLAALPGARTKVRYVWHKLVPPRAYMEQSTPLARRGRSGLFFAYVRRIATAPVQLPSAWRGFWRFRRRVTDRNDSSSRRGRRVGAPRPPNG